MGMDFSASASARSHPAGSLSATTWTTREAACQCPYSTSPLPQHPHMPVTAKSRQCTISLANATPKNNRRVKRHAPRFSCVFWSFTLVLCGDIKRTLPGIFFFQDLQLQAFPRGLFDNRDCMIGKTGKLNAVAKNVKPVYRVSVQTYLRCHRERFLARRKLVYNHPTQKYAPKARMWRPFTK
eukprot:6471229-Amphidinium_carterae.1